MPCDVWHTEQENPSEECRLCCVKLVFAKISSRSWHFAHIA